MNPGYIIVHERTVRIPPGHIYRDIDRVTFEGGPLFLVEERAANPTTGGWCRWAACTCGSVDPTAALRCEVWDCG